MYYIHTDNDFDVSLRRKKVSKSLHIVTLLRMSCDSFIMNIVHIGHKVIRCSTENSDAA